MKTFILIGVIVFYLLSCFGAWRFIGKAYSKGGRWQNIHPTTADIIMVFIPMVNTMVALTNHRGDRYESENDTSSFFKVVK